MNPEGYDIYTEIEAHYKASLLKKKARSYNIPEMLEEFHEKASTTLEVLHRNMIMGEVPIHRLLEIYKEHKRSNVIKLLLRCEKLYQARADVKKILVTMARL